MHLNIDYRVTIYNQSGLLDIPANSMSTGDNHNILAQYLNAARFGDDAFLFKA